ncbi:MAG: aromatic ring-hydroxylating dioxygenase subunit alpha [Pseudomonadota bacterium]
MGDIFARSDPALPPGTARCPGGPSPQETLRADGPSTPGTLLEERAPHLGSDDLPFSRYTDPAFHEREVERLWSRTWQWACREEHVPEPGDYYVYDIDRYSVVIVRGADTLVRAFVNSCPHRGMQFVEAGSCGSGKQFLRCPFHGMSWSLEGALREIPCRWDFPHVDDNEFRLPEVACDSWGGFIFINLDPQAPPLQSYLGVLPDHFAHTPLEHRFVRMHTEKVLHGNWKMVMEAFLEAYHVLATHPLGLQVSSWANTQYDLFDRHVSRFLQVLSSGNPHYPKPLSEQALVEALGHEGVTLKPGERARDVHAAAVRERLGAEYGTDLSGVSNSIMLDSIEYFLFPNACFFPGVAIPLVYRFRPLGPDRTLHDILQLQPLPDSGERPPPAPVVRLDIDRSYTTVEGFGSLDIILDQDSENFRRQWAGFRAARKEGQTLGNYQESRIRHFHQTLDEYLA